MEQRNLLPHNTKTNVTNDSVFLHLRNNPCNPNSSKIQRRWRQFVQQPKNCKNLSDIENAKGDKVGINRLIVCYKRHLNLGNLLSYRLIDRKPGLPVSSSLPEEIRNCEGLREREREREKEKERERERGEGQAILHAL